MTILTLALTGLESEHPEPFKMARELNQRLNEGDFEDVNKDRVTEILSDPTLQDANALQLFASEADFKEQGMPGDLSDFIGNDDVELTVGGLRERMSTHGWIVPSIREPETHVGTSAIPDEDFALRVKEYEFPDYSRNTLQQSHLLTARAISTIRKIIHRDTDVRILGDIDFDHLFLYGAGPVTKAEIKRLINHLPELEFEELEKGDMPQRIIRKASRSEYGDFYAEHAIYLFEEYGIRTEQQLYKRDIAEIIRELNREREDLLKKERQYSDYVRREEFLQEIMNFLSNFQIDPLSRS